MAQILIIDDEEQVRTMLARMLRQAGYEVIEAEDGKVGSALFRAEPVDLIITDILMPEKDGLEVMREMTKEFPTVKIFAFTGGGTTGRLNLLPAAEHMGAIRTFKKPFGRSELLTAVEEVIGKPAASAEDE